MKFNLIHYLRHGRYRPKNLIESLFAQHQILSILIDQKIHLFISFGIKKHLNRRITITNLGDLYY